MDDTQLYQIRPRIAEILETVARYAFPRARDLDIALDAIFCAFAEGGDCRGARRTEARMIRTITSKEWRSEGESLFGPNMMDWKFICPVCGHIAAGHDWKAAGSTPNAIGFSCVGRWLDSKRDAFEGKGNGPCNYAGGGLFKMNPVTVTPDDGGEPITMFEFARAA